MRTTHTRVDAPLQAPSFSSQGLPPARPDPPERLVELYGLKELLNLEMQRFSKTSLLAPFLPQPCLCRGSSVYFLTSSTPTQLVLSKLVAWRDAKCSCAAQEINLTLYSCPVVFVQFATQHMLYLEQFLSLQSTLHGKKTQPNPMFSPTLQRGPDLLMLWINEQPRFVMCRRGEG